MLLLVVQCYVEVEDVEDFYSKGLGMVEQGDVIWCMVCILLQDFFDEVDVIECGQCCYLVKLCFVYVEIVILLVVLLCLFGVLQQVVECEFYVLVSNGWCGVQIVLMVVNL